MFKEAIPDITALGGFSLYIVVTLLSLVIGQIELFWLLTIALILMHTIASMIKLVWFKERPDSQKYKSWIGKIDASSFPSVHSARALILWGIIAWFFQSTYVLLLAISVTLATGYSRVVLNRHYLKDVIAGYVLGAVVLSIVLSVI